MKIYIGWDSKQQEASDVCEYSIHKYARYPVEVVHLKKDELIEQRAYYRPEGDPASTEFTYTRFLLPWLNNYTGWSVFVDSDFLFQHDVTSMLDYIENTRISNNRAVYVCKHHEYVPKSETKFWGKPQMTFPRKNWSSLMVFNNSHTACRRLHPLSVSNQSPQWLHRFEWCNDDQIGEISLLWNWLVGEYESDVPGVRGLHFTNGGPWNDVWGQDYEDLWLDTYEEMIGFPFRHIKR